MSATGDSPVVVEMSDVSHERGLSGESSGASPASWKYGQSNLAFRDVGFEVTVRKGSRGEKGKKTILTPVSGVFSAGSMVALIGPSGCGKTTLLDIIAGKKTAPYTGEVFLNGRPRDKLYSRVTSYVPQQDVMPTYCTVSEVVEFNHKLRVDLGGTPGEAQERRRICDEVLQNFGLLGVKDQIIGDAFIRGISGGQKRRTTLARGFVGGAQIIFADEPTSGLSATDAEVCVRAMRNMTESKGVTFVVVIHQPRIEVGAMFDHLVLMTSNPGRFVYNGPFRDAAQYFSDAGFPPPKFGNPTDYYLDVITPDIKDNKADYFAKRYSEGQAFTVQKAVEDSVRAGGKPPVESLKETARRAGAPGFRHGYQGIHSVSFKGQISALMKRRLTLTARDTRQLNARFMTASLQGLIIGVAFLDIGKKLPVQQLSFLFMLLQIGALSNMAVMPEMMAQRLVFKFESSDGLYSTAAAVIVDTAVNNTLAVLGNFLTTCVMFSLSGLSWDTFGTLYFWSIMCFLVMVNFFKIIAAVAPTHAESIQVAMPGLMMFILFNNFFVNQATAPAFMRWALYVSPMAWTIEQIITGLYPGNVDLYKLFGYDDSAEQSVRAFAVLLSEAILFQAIALVCLARLNNIQR
jgi:ABC-type multidrug transport system ATPase subunit